MYKAGLGTKKRSERLISLALALLVVAGGITGAWMHWHHTAAQTTANTSPVPKSVAQAVNFPVYYPDPQKLPAGYTLNTNSFTSPVKNGVTYSVSYDNGKKIVFSIQVKPTDSELQTFNSSYIPLRIDYQTPIGQAEIGAYNNHGDTQTLVSLPTKTNSWIIITAPYNIDQGNLKKVLSSLKTD
jgi:hypothetical protein